MRLEQHTIVRRPKGKAYRGLLDFAVHRCAWMTLVVTPYLGKSSFVEELEADGHDVLKQLRPHLISQTRALEWPGTLRYDEPSTLLKYRFDEASVRVIKRATDSLFGWLQPRLPEDLCLYYPNGAVWLASISHEKDAFLRTTAECANMLRRDLPQIKLKRDIFRNGEWHRAD